MKKEKENTPILLANTEWIPPKNLLEDVKHERMINGLLNMIKPLKPEEQVGYAEVVAYLMPATQKAPISSDLAKIYLYCCTQYLKKKGRIEDLPKDIIIEELTNYEKEELRKLKLWIYEKRGGKERNPLLFINNKLLFII